MHRMSLVAHIQSVSSGAGNGMTADVRGATWMTMTITTRMRGGTG